MTCIPPEPCSGITSYEQLKDLPSINGEVVIKDKSCEDFHLQCAMRPIKNFEIERLFELYVFRR